MLASFAALAAIGAASISAYALTDLKIFAERSALPEAASVPIPDPAISTVLNDVQLSQRQNAAVLQQNAAALERLAATSIAQQADLHRLSDQLSSLIVRTEAPQKAGAPITTSAIAPPRPRPPVAKTPHKQSSRLPTPAGPISVGGAPLRPALASGGG
jgi:hypothetical protein